MALNKVYTRINWEDYPSENTDIDEINLNKMDSAIDALDNRIISQDALKVDKSAINGNIADWTMDETTGIITITKYNGEKVIFDLNIEKIPVGFSMSDDGIITMTTEDGTQFTADIGSMIPVLTFEDSATIAVSVTGTGKNKTYSFSIKTGSVTDDMLQPNYLADIRVESANASAYAQSANAKSVLAESYAVGGTGTREGEDTDNAKYYMEQAEKQTGGIPTKLSQLENDAGFIAEDGDGSGLTVGFTEAAARENIASGENTGTLMGKIKKWLADLAAAAFMQVITSYADLMAGTALDNYLIGAAAAKEGFTELNGKLSLYTYGDKVYGSSSTTISPASWSAQWISIVIPDGYSFFTAICCSDNDVVCGVSAANYDSDNNRLLVNAYNRHTQSRDFSHVYIVPIFIRD